MSQKYDEYLEKHRQAVKKAYQWIAAYIPELTDVEATRNNTRSIVEEILEMIRTKLTEVENAEN